MDLLGWLDRFTLFRRDKIPLIGFSFNQFHAAVQPSLNVVFPQAIITAGTSVFPVFEREGCIAKIKLSLSVHGNAANVTVGAYAFKVTGNTATGLPAVTVTPTSNVVAAITTTQASAHVQTTLDFMPYGGYRMQSGESVVLAICNGNGAPIFMFCSLLLMVMYQPARIIRDGGA